MPTAQPPSRDAAIEARVFWIKFRKELAVLLLLALLGMVGFAGYRFYSDRRDTAAANLLAGAKTASDNEQVIAQFSDTPAAASAYLLLAEAQRKDKKFAEANTTLQTFINKYPKHELVATAQMAMAANLESIGKSDQVLAMYQQIAASFPKSYIAPFALLAQVELLKTKGRIDEARRICEAIMTNYRDSMVVGEANRQLRSLKPSSQTQSAATWTNAPAPPPMLARPPELRPVTTPAVPPVPTAPPKPKP
jgi:TolA-binding protein